MLKALSAVGFGAEFFEALSIIAYFFLFLPPFFLDFFLSKLNRKILENTFEYEHRELHCIYTKFVP